MTETGWVIEHAESQTSRPIYWAGWGWSIDHMAAIRCARKIDAERLRMSIDDFMGADRHRVAEHGWDDDPQPSHGGQGDTDAPSD